MLRALPWYEGEGGRIVAMAFGPAPMDDRLLCGTADGGVYVIPCDAVLAGDAARDESEEEKESDEEAEVGDRKKTKKTKTKKGRPEPMIQVLNAGGSAVVSVAWLRASDAAGHPTAVVVTAAGEVKFWAAPSFSSLASAKVGCARAESAELVDAGARGVTFLLIAGYEASAENTSRADRVYWTLKAARRRRSETCEPVLGRFGVDAPGDVEGLDVSSSAGGGRDGGRRRRAAAPPGERAPMLQAHPGANGGDDGSGSLVSCLRRRAGGGRLGRLELFDPAIDERVPTAVHLVPRGTVSVRVTTRFVFALNGVVGRRARLTVIARRKPPGDANRGKETTPDATETPAPDVALQEIVLSSNCGFPRGLMPPGLGWAPTTPQTWRGARFGCPARCWSADNRCPPSGRCSGGSRARRRRARRPRRSPARSKTRGVRTAPGGCAARSRPGRRARDSGTGSPEVPPRTTLPPRRVRSRMGTLRSRR